MEYLGFLVVLAMLLLLLFAGIQVAFAMTIVGVIVLFFVKGTVLLDMVAWTSWATANSFILTAIPLFLLMGDLIFRGGVAADLYRGITAWLYWLPGKCLQANIMSCSVFAAICGSSVATAATFGKIAVAPQLEQGYSPRHVCGSLAGGGTLGIMIPPSIDLIVYGSLTEQSIPKLFAAGIIPGTILTCLFLTVTGIAAVRNPSIAPDVPVADRTWPVRIHSLAFIVPVMALAVLVLGGMYAGIFTPTEAAGVGAGGAFLLVLLLGRMSWGLLWESAISTGITSAWMIFILIGANITGFAMGQSGLAKRSVEAITHLQLSPTLFMIVLMVLYMLLGCVLEGLSITLLTVVTVYPIVLAMGLNPIWFGIMLVLQAECAFLTPPVGLNLFVLAGISKVPMEEVIKGAFPYFVCLLVMIGLLIAFPNLALIIPSRM
jgi:C4-dicarboxylate transporter DctM subunit